MAHGARLMAHDSWLMAHDSWLMAHGSWPITNLPRGPQAPSHEIPLNIPTPTPAPDHLLGGHNELGGTSVE